MYTTSNSFTFSKWMTELMVGGRIHGWRPQSFTLSKWMTLRTTITQASVRWIGPPVKKAPPKPIPLAKSGVLELVSVYHMGKVVCDIEFFDDDAEDAHHIGGEDEPPNLAGDRSAAMAGLVALQLQGADDDYDSDASLDL
jgi:hypothetical protein